MKTKLTFEQWTNRFFEQTNFSRDILESDTILAVLKDEFAKDRSVADAAENLRNAIWSEECA